MYLGAESRAAKWGSMLLEPNAADGWRTAA
jgi:hypothetical protein